MISLNEEALICDLAETYHIYEYKRLPMRLVASFANGLRDGSRIRMIMSGSNVSTETLLLASIFDKLNILIWQNTRDGRKGANKPVSLAAKFIEVEAKENSFTSGEDFEKRRNELLVEIGGVGNGG